jgi:hypothetical protein
MTADFQARPGCERAKTLLGEAKRSYQAILAACPALPANAREGLERAIGLLARFEATACEDEDEPGGAAGEGMRKAVTLHNRGVDNIHICINCSGASFTTGNRLAPGQSARLEVAIPEGRQSVEVRFNAGRNQVVRASVVCAIDRDTARTVRYTESAFNVGSALSCE